MFYMRHHKHHHHGHWLIFLLALVGAYFLGKESQKKGWSIFEVEWKDITSNLCCKEKDSPSTQNPPMGESPSPVEI